MKNKKYYLIFLMLLFVGIYTAKSQVTKENLNTYLTIAAKNNPGLKALFNNYLAAMEKVPQVGALPDPKIAFSYFAQSVETRVGPQKWKATLAQAFPWFGLLKAKKDVATNLAKAKYEIFENAKSNLFFEVKIVDELRVELEINELENKLALLQDTKKVVATNFNNLLNRDINATVLVPADLWQEDLPIDESKLIDGIYENNHSLKSIDQKILAFANQETVAKKSGLPKFTLGFGYVDVADGPLTNFSDNGKNAYFPSIGLTIPIYRKKYKAMLKEATLLQGEAQSDKKERKNNLNTLNKRIIKDYKDSKRRIVLNAKQTHIAKKALDVLLISYSANDKDFEEVLRMERKLLKYELAYQKAVSDKNAAVAFINYLLGK